MVLLTYCNAASPLHDYRSMALAGGAVAAWVALVVGAARVVGADCVACVAYCVALCSRSRGLFV